MAGAMAFAGLDLTAAPAEDSISKTAESIHQEPEFPMSRARVYEALLDAKQFAKVVQLSAAVQPGMALGNRPVEISRQVGGAFTVYGGHIVGRQIELAPNERICASVARGGLETRRVLDREVPAGGGGSGNANRVRPYGVSGGPGRAFGGGVVG